MSSRFCTEVHMDSPNKLQKNGRQITKLIITDSGVQTLSSIFCTFIIYPSLRNFFRESLKLYFLYGSLQAVHTNFHAKSGVCSSKNGRVMAISLIFPSLRKKFRESLKLFFCMDPCRQFIRTSMQNLESVAQKMSELLH